MPLITDAIFTTHQKEIYDHMMRGSLKMFTDPFNDSSAWSNVKRSKTSFWRDGDIIDMVLVNGVYQLKI